MKIKAFALGTGMAALVGGSAHAAVIIYELTATANYTLGGVVHTGFMDITGVGSTSGVVIKPGTTLEANGTITGLDSAPFAISINLTGVGVFNVVGNGYVFDLQSSPLGGFGAAGGADFVYFRSPVLSTYDLASALAAIPVNFYAGGQGSVATTGGTLNIATFTNGQFSARVTAAPPPSGSGSVPEPATWAMMLAGFGGLGAALRTRRRTVDIA